LCLGHPATHVVASLMHPVAHVVDASGRWRYTLVRALGTRRLTLVHALGFPWHISGRLGHPEAYPGHALWYALGIRWSTLWLALGIRRQTLFTHLGTRKNTEANIVPCLGQPAVLRMVWYALGTPRHMLCLGHPPVLVVVRVGAPGDARYGLPYAPGGTRCGRLRQPAAHVGAHLRHPAAHVGATLRPALVHFGGTPWAPGGTESHTKWHDLGSRWHI
jgi:hypothetical protein